MVSYFEVIRNPMDLSTMSAKLEEGMYKDRNAFEADFRLMIRNAKTYNMPNTYAYNESLTIESFFDRREDFRLTVTRTVNTVMS